MGRRRKGGSAKRESRRSKAPARREVRLDELKAIVERARVGPLSAEDCEVLGGAVDTLAWLTQELETKGVSIQRLRKLIFGSSTEKTSRVLGEEGAE
ncbi:MAG: hypothetical protein QME77_14490, partial [bacterium]|nr:hypothetical protein [bacterium]